MSEVIWHLPFPSSGLGPGVDFLLLTGHSCALSCRDDDYGFVRIIFEGVEAFKCTYYLARTLEMISTYDSLTDLGVTPWLSSIQKQVSAAGGEWQSLRHLMIYFDDGPCYEFICRNLRVEDEGAI